MIVLYVWIWAFLLVEYYSNGRRTSRIVWSEWSRYCLVKMMLNYNSLFHDVFAATPGLWMSSKFEYLWSLQLLFLPVKLFCYLEAEIFFPIPILGLQGFGYWQHPFSVQILLEPLSSHSLDLFLDLFEIPPYRHLHIGYRYRLANQRWSLLNYLVTEVKLAARLAYCYARKVSSVLIIYPNFFE